VLILYLPADAKVARELGAAALKLNGHLAAFGVGGCPPREAIECNVRDGPVVSIGGR